MHLAKCRYVDDWFLARLAHDFQDQLVFLDLSECPSVGATGILALCRLKYVLYFRISLQLCSSYDRSLKKLRLFNLPAFNGKELATMIFEENVPGCFVEGVNYETEPIAGLLQAGDEEQQQNDIPMIDTGEQEHLSRKSIRLN